jgi:hypothetical protein
MNDLEKLKKLANTQARDKAMIEGKIESLIDDLKEYGYSDESKAIKSMKVLKEKLDSKRSLFEKKLNQFRTTHDKELSKIN